MQGSYYFRPSVDYDFTRGPDGQRLGGGAAVIWESRDRLHSDAGSQSDLGIELNLSLYYQSKDGKLNDHPERMGGFFSMVQYGVLFPMGGLNFLRAEASNSGVTADTSSAHVLRWFLGVLF